VNKITNHQTLPKLTILPILLGITATVIIATQKPITAESGLGIVLAIASIILGTAGSILNGWYGANSSAWTRATIPNLLGTLILAPVLLINLTDTTATHPDWTMIVIAFLIALLPGVIAKALTLYALKTIPVPLVMEASTLAIITATLSSWLFLGQGLSVTTIIGVSIGIGSTIILAILIGKQKEPNHT
jgi:probable blue pigment (indigoidine) exporter